MKNPYLKAEQVEAQIIKDLELEKEVNENSGLYFQTTLQEKLSRLNYLRTIVSTCQLLEAQLTR